MAQHISEYLEIEGEAEHRVVQCIKCKYVFGPPGRNYKGRAVVSEKPPGQAAPHLRGADDFVMREFYCPGCATMLDVEICVRGAPYVWDKLA